jgi:hypothetical protein
MSLVAGVALFNFPLLLISATMINLDTPIVPAQAGYIVDLENPRRRGKFIFLV